MSHDQLCPQYDGDDVFPSERCEQGDWGCRCDLIARVREDERATVVAELMSNHGHGERLAYERGFKEASDLCDGGAEEAKRFSASTRVEDERKPQRDAIARSIADSEAFMWLMVGANHPEHHLAALREAYAAYAAVDGGYGRYMQRHQSGAPAATIHVEREGAGDVED